MDGVEWTGYPLDSLTTRALAGIKSRICTLANNQLCGMVTTKWVCQYFTKNTSLSRLEYSIDTVLNETQPRQTFDQFTNSFDVE